MYDDYCRTLYFKAWMRDGIFHCVYTVNFLTLPVAEQVVANRLQIFGGTPYPVLADIRAVRGADPEVSKYLSSGEAIRLVTAGALLVNSQFHKIAGNVFLHFHKPSIPAKLFTEESEAMAWLCQFRKPYFTV
jgi:hypothetical protein